MARALILLPCAFSLAPPHLGLVRPVISSYWLFADAVELLFPPAFALFVLFRRSRPGPFPSWAKKLALGAAAAGLVVVVLHYTALHYREFGVTNDGYMVLMHLWRTLGGVVTGIIVSIIVSCGRNSPS